MIDLNDPSLLTGSVFINGSYVSDDKVFSVTNPAIGEELAQVADLDIAELRNASAAAHAAQKPWARIGKDRAAHLRRWHDLIMANQEDLARILTAEMDKPLAEARGEIAMARPMSNGSPKRPSASMAIPFPGICKTSA